MATPTEELEAARISAGTIYAEATKAYWDAYVELHAIEHALQNSKFKRVNTAPLGFGPAPDPIAMRHSTFTPSIVDAPDGCAFAWHDRAHARMLQILANGGVS